MQIQTTRYCFSHTELAKIKMLWCNQLVKTWGRCGERGKGERRPEQTARKINLERSTSDSSARNLLAGYTLEHSPEYMSKGVHCKMQTHAKCPFIDKIIYDASIEELV